MQKNRFYLILDNIRSAHNVGSIFRTADAAGIDKIYLCGYTPRPDKNDKIAKTALGAEKTVTWEHHALAWKLIENLKKEGVHVVALEQDPTAIDIFDFKAQFPLALVVGNEVKGISKALLKRAETILAIPQYGRKESLNVSVATGIAIYTLLHRR